MFLDRELRRVVEFIRLAENEWHFKFIGQKIGMRYVGILLVLCSFPIFLWVLRSGASAQRWAIMALGALPVIGIALNIDAAFVSWAGWPGHTKGIIISLTDTLALAICVRLRNRAGYPQLMWMWIVYIACNIPGIFLGNFIAPALFYIVSLIKAAVYFFACYIVIYRGGLFTLVTGLCIAVFANSGTTILNFLQGQALPSGLVGHRNYAGMINNLAVPILLVVGTFGRLRTFPLLAVGVAGVAAILGSSRAVLILFGVTIYLTLILLLLVKPSKQTKQMLGVCVILSFLAIPIGIQKISQRSEDGQIVLTKDAERLAFERAARMMNKDYPLGIGLNQYAVLANAGGYSTAAGVGWATASLSATVHNSYALVRTEGGPIALMGLLVLLTTTVATSIAFMLRRRNNPARVFAIPAFVSVLVLSIHISIEWVFVSMNTLYAFASVMAVIAYTKEASRKDALQKKHASTPSEVSLSDNYIA